MEGGRDLPPPGVGGKRRREEEPQGAGSRGGGGAGGGGPPPGPALKADFGLSGALAQDARTGNVKNGVELKWAEPADARAPTAQWRLYVYKGGDAAAAPIDTLYIHRQSAYLIGRDRAVADLPVDHPSASKQHAVIQFRLVALPQEAGDMSAPQRAVKPYVMDLASTNGTFINGERVAEARYVELRPQDVIRFANSSREYVLMAADA